MTKQQILQTAIQKAIDNGWLTTLASTMVEWSVESDGSDGIRDLTINRKMLGKSLYKTFPEQYIFNHNFAKALWGEDKTCPAGHFMSAHTLFCKEEWCGQEKSGLLSWQYHLQQMVISEDPIKY